MSSSWLRRLGIGELCSIWREWGEKGRAGLDVCVKVEREMDLGAKGEWVHGEEGGEG